MQIWSLLASEAMTVFRQWTNRRHVRTASPMQMQSSAASGCMAACNLSFPLFPRCIPDNVWTANASPRFYPLTFIQSLSTFLSLIIFLFRLSFLRTHFYGLKFHRTQFHFNLHFLSMFFKDSLGNFTDNFFLITPSWYFSQSTSKSPLKLSQARQWF
jgi:hypothetical protein